MTNLKEIILDLINNSEDLVLTVGENEYYTENDTYSLSIRYSLEEKDYPICNDRYDFNVQMISLIVNKTNEEFEIEADNDITFSIMDNCIIENWSNETDIDLDEYLEDNF